MDAEEALRLELDCRRRLIQLSQRLVEPQDYNAGVPGETLDEPDNIMFLRRDPSMRISFAVDHDNLYHRKYVLSICLRTDGLVCVNQSTFPLPEGYAALVHPYHSHHYLVDQNTFFWLVITFEFTRGKTTLPGFRSVRMRSSTYWLVERMLMAYLELPGNSDPTQRLLLQRYLGCLLLELGNEPEFREPNRLRPHTGSRLELFEEINGYIFKRLADSELSVRAIASTHQVSVSTLHGLFRALAGCNPGEYIRWLRIEQARKLLDSRELKVREVAERTGFSSLSIFSRCFRKTTGISPREYINGLKFMPPNHS